jgi:hypothetical protein
MLILLKPEFIVFNYIVEAFLRHQTFLKFEFFLILNFTFIESFEILNLLFMALIILNHNFFQGKLHLEFLIMKFRDLYFVRFFHFGYSNFHLS